MTRRKKEISFDAEWIRSPIADMDIKYDDKWWCYISLYKTRPLCKRIIRALGKKRGKIRITLERVE